MTVLLASALMALLGVGDEGTQSTRVRSSTAKIDQLLARLGSEVLEEREEAMKALRSVGESAWRQLRDAAQTHADPEIRSRAETLQQEIERGWKIRTCQGPKLHAAAMAFSANYERVLIYSGESEPGHSGTIDFSIRLWELATGLEKLQRPLMLDRVVQLEMSNKGDLAILVDSSHVPIRILDLKTGCQIQGLSQPGDVMQRATFSPDAAHVYSCGAVGWIRKWDLKTGAQKVLCTCPHPTGMVLGPDCSTALIASKTHACTLWDLRTGQVRFEFPAAKNALCVAISPRGTRALSGSPDTNREADRQREPDCGVRLLDLTNGKVIRILEGHRNLVTRVAISPDGRWGLSASRKDNDVKVWNLETGEEVRCFRANTPNVLCLAFSRDGQIIYVGNQDNSVQLFKAPK